MKSFSELKMINGAVILGALIVSGFEGAMAGAIQKLFAYPSACAASLFLGAAPLMTEGKEVFIPMADQMINVTSKCSAFGFFCLLSAVLLIKVLERLPKNRVLAGTLLAVPLAYGITLAANGVRIICAYYAFRIGQVVLPPNFQAALHQGVGITVFLSTLIAVTLILERDHPHEQHSR